MGKTPKIIEIIKECQKINFESFELFFTSEIKETDIKPYYWNHYVESYILCKGLVKIREDFYSTLSSTICIYYHFCG